MIILPGWAWLRVRLAIVSSLTQHEPWAWQKARYQLRLTLQTSLESHNPASRLAPVSKKWLQGLCITRSFDGYTTLLILMGGHSRYNLCKVRDWRHKTHCTSRCNLEKAIPLGGKNPALLPWMMDIIEGKTCEETMFEEVWDLVSVKADIVRAHWRHIVKSGPWSLRTLLIGARKQPVHDSVCHFLPLSFYSHNYSFSTISRTFSVLRPHIIHSIKQLSV